MEHFVPTNSDVFGAGPLTYTAVSDWPKLPAGWSFVEVVGIAADSRDRAFVFCRGVHPVMIFEPDGTFVQSWGEGLFVRPHGITIGPADEVYCSDDKGHAVYKFDPQGRLLMTLGTPGRPSETGVQGMDYRTIRRGGEPFNMPTNLAIAENGDLYITDGYGNARVHVFSPEGKLKFSWGEPGSAPGQFNLPHGIAIDRQQRVYVADRENSRIQLFSLRGDYLGEWTDTARPMQIAIDKHDRVFVCDVGWRAGLFPWQSPPSTPPRGAYVSVFDSDGRLLSRWGGGASPCAAGDFFAPHGICLDSTGAVYVGEVVMSAGGYKGIVPPTCHPLQKFVPAA
jgi:DNA-binding beta-propeller fold protein YncE